MGQPGELSDFRIGDGCDSRTPNPYEPEVCQDLLLGKDCQRPEFDDGATEGKIAVPGETKRSYSKRSDQSCYSMTPREVVPVQAIIFDLDGLMVDSEALAKEAWRKVLQRYGHELDTSTIHDLLGLQLADSSRLVWERFRPPISAEQLATEKDRLFLEMVSGNLRPMPGLYDLLDAVDERRLLRAIATSSRSNYAAVALESIGVDGFAAVVTADLVKAGKPAPDIYLAAAKMLDLPPSACIALEDSPNGVQAAQSAGMRCVAVPNAMAAATDLGAADWLYPSLRAVASDLDILIRGMPRSDL